MKGGYNRWYSPLCCSTDWGMMERENSTEVTEFILLGLTQSQDVQLLVFTLVLIFYLILLPGNFLIILTIRSDPASRPPSTSSLGNPGLPGCILLLHCELPGCWWTSSLTRRYWSPIEAASLSSCFSCTFWGQGRCSFLSWWPLTATLPSVESFTLFDCHEP